MRKRPKPQKKPNGRPVLEPFVLAPLRKYRPRAVIGDSNQDRFNDFVLALALAFNDLKDLYLFRKSLSVTEPDPAEISPHAGQWNGMTIHLDRLMIAHLHETLMLIREFESEARSDRTTRLFESAPPDVRRDWEILVNTATDKGSPADTSFAKVLKQLRHNAAFHYYQPKPLVSGFRRHFFETPPAANNNSAFASIGRNLEETRFYFADAAVQGALAVIVGKIGSDKFRRRLNRALVAVNNAVEHIVEEHIKGAQENN